MFGGVGQNPQLNQKKDEPELIIRNLDEDTDTKKPSSSSVSIGWLLRLFRSEFFDAWMAVTYLYRYRDNRGVHDYLCNELYKLTDADIESFLPQLCNHLLHHARNSQPLERFIMDKCAESMHIALQVYWHIQAAVEDSIRETRKDDEKKYRLLRTRCETAAVNGSSHSELSYLEHSGVNKALVVGEPNFSIDLPEQVSIDKLDIKDSAPGSSTPNAAPNRNSNSTDFNNTTQDSNENSEGLKHPLSHSQSLERSASVPSNMVSDVSPSLSASKKNSISKTSNSYKEAAVDSGSYLGECMNQTDDSPDRTPYVKDLMAETEELMNFDAAPIPFALTPKDEISNNSFVNFGGHVKHVFNVPTDSHSAMLAVKQERFDYFNDSLTVVKALVKLSFKLKDVEEDIRQTFVTHGLNKINEILRRRMAGESTYATLGTPKALPSWEEIALMGEFAALRSIHLPLGRASEGAIRILRIVPQETVVMKTRERAPYMIWIEAISTGMLAGDKNIFCEQLVYFKPPEISEPLISKDDDEEVTNVEGDDTTATSNLAKTMTDPARRLKETVYTMVYGTSKGNKFSNLDSIFQLHEETETEEVIKKRLSVFHATFGELWSEKENRILKDSPFGSLPGVKIYGFIAKANDDLRQEQLAIQLITQFDQIFKAEGVKLWLRPFTIICSSSDSGLIETLRDSVSLHSLKKRTPNYTSLRKYFENAYGPANSKSLRLAQRRFIRSMAGYSLVTYFLQIKDRHNGNIMIDADGHVIHIDFGFMLSNSPGSIKFESAPFKLTEEFLEVMAWDAASETTPESNLGYHYFRELFVRGFLAARKHYEKLTTLVEIMSEGSTMPCMQLGHVVVEALRQRFLLGLPEKECITAVLALIDESCNNWRTRQYDRYQYYTNGIL